MSHNRHNQGDQEYQHKTAAPAHDEVARQLREGYEDRRLGVTRERRAVEAWDEPHQRNYEAGRRIAACLGYYCTLPPWPRHVPFQELTFEAPQEAVDAFYVEDGLTKRRPPEPPPLPARDDGDFERRMRAIGRGLRAPRARRHPHRAG